MEGKTTELLDQELFENKNLTEVLLEQEKLNDFISENKIGKKSDEELAQDRETLNIFLKDLKKENFKLEATLAAWKNTLKNNLGEFTEADLKLDKIYKEIQSEREDFCSKSDIFINKYGVLSDWWEKQMKFVFDYVNLDLKNSEEQNFKQKIKQAEQEIKEIEQQIEFLQAEKNSEPEEDFTIVRSDGNSEDFSPEKLFAKKNRMSEEEDENQIKFCEENGNELEKRFFSLVDVEKVRLATRKMKYRRNFSQRD